MRITNLLDALYDEPVKHACGGPLLTKTRSSAHAHNQPARCPLWWACEACVWRPSAWPPSYCSRPPSLLADPPCILTKRHGSRNWFALAPFAVLIFVYAKKFTEKCHQKVIHTGRQCCGAEIIYFRLWLPFVRILAPAQAPAIYCHFKLYYNSSTIRNMSQWR